MSYLNKSENSSITIFKVGLNHNKYIDIEHINILLYVHI